MPYAAEISRTSPSCFLFLIDQSQSMADLFGSGETPRTKAQGVADALNKLLSNLVIKCAKSGGVRDYYHIGVVGYGATVGPAFTGPLSGRELVPVSEIATSPARVEERPKKVDDGAGGLVEQKIRFPIWFEPCANGGTPMCQAMAEAQRVVSGWLQLHPDCFPPVVIHITDGESTDGDPGDAMQAVRSLASSDGNVLLFNIHLSSKDATEIIFPDSRASLKDAYSLMLFDTASPLTPTMQRFAKDQGHAVGEGARGFVLNASLVTLIEALDIGTRPSNLR
jgi:hypothetical protein